MSKIDYSSLDGHSLRTFLTVLEEGSVSRAAGRLEVSQSAVSHTLEKLRTIFGDPLFVRLGRGIEPTARALALQKPVEAILEQLGALTSTRDFDPFAESMDFTIATNDFPLQLIFPSLLREISDQGIDLSVRFIPAGIPRASTLRASRYRLLITPTPPGDQDLVTHSLVTSTMAVFYDPKMRKPPASREAYLACNYAEVRFSDTESSSMALTSFDRSKLRQPQVTVPNFGSLCQMVQGTDRITTQIEVMGRGLLQGLACSPLPFKTDPLDLYLVWHKREHNDPAHRWFRERIIERAVHLLGN